jgi:hypothetical protein
MNLISPKVGAKHELLFNGPATRAGLFNKSSCLTQALDVTKFITIIAMFLVTLGSET